MDALKKGQREVKVKNRSNKITISVKNVELVEKEKNVDTGKLNIT